ncbi:MAG: 4Fe-4S binding protein [Candidatus Cloacimonetes bacterium]|nr:4Fe-4S binding protein [Candidatus Cloacimonadota bacterium]
MTYKIISEKCDLCACCVALCESDAVRIGKNSAYILQDECISCKKCFVVCPISAIKEIIDETPIRYFGTKDNEN